MGETARHINLRHFIYLKRLLTSTIWTENVLEISLVCGVYLNRGEAWFYHILALYGGYRISYCQVQKLCQNHRSYRF